MMSEVAKSEGGKYIGRLWQYGGVLPNGRAWLREVYIVKNPIREDPPIPGAGTAGKEKFSSLGV